MRDNLILGTLTFILMGAIAFAIHRRFQPRKHRKGSKLEPPQSTVI